LGSLSRLKKAKAFPFCAGAQPAKLNAYQKSAIFSQMNKAFCEQKMSKASLFT